MLKHDPPTSEKQKKEKNRTVRGRVGVLIPILICISRVQRTRKTLAKQY